MMTKGQKCYVVDLDTYEVVEAEFLDITEQAEVVVHIDFYEHNDIIPGNYVFEHNDIGLAEAEKLLDKEINRAIDEHESELTYLKRRQNEQEQ